MGYISLTTWRDLTDGHLYREGDPFPFDGREIDGDRLAELETGSNRAGLRLIRAVDAGMKQEHGRKEEGPETAPESRETASEYPKPKRTKVKK